MNVARVCERACVCVRVSVYVLARECVRVCAGKDAEMLRCQIQQVQESVGEF